MSNFKYYLLLITLLIFGAFLRIYSLSKESLVLDEAQSVWQASHSPSFILHYSAQNVHLPLHNLLLHYWITLFGASESSVRMLAVIPGILVLPYIYLLAYEVTHSRKNALLAYTFACLSPFWVWYSREIRMYTLLILFVTISYYLFLRFISTSKLKYLVLYTIINIIGVYTHYFFNLALLVEGSFLLLALYNYWIIGDKHFKFNLSFKLFMSWLVTFTFLGFWIIYYLRNNQGGELAPNLATPSKFDIVLSLFNFTFGYQPVAISTILISMWPLLALFGFIFLKKRKKIFLPKIYMLLVGFVLPIALVYFVSVTVKPIYLTRYLVAATPLYLIWISWLLLQTPGVYGRAFVVFAIFSLVGANYSQFTRADIPDKEDYRTALNYVAENATDRDVVILNPPYLYFPAEYYADASMSITTLPIWDRSKLNIPAVTDAQISNDLKVIRNGHRNMYLISALNLSGAPDVVYYMDHNFTRLSSKKISETLWVAVYQSEYPVVARR